MDLSVITTFLSQYGTWGMLLAGVLTLTSDYWMPWVSKFIPIFKGSEGDEFRAALTGIREKASHRECFKTCEARIDAFTKLDAVDELLDVLYPVETAK